MNDQIARTTLEAIARLMGLGTALQRKASDVLECLVATMYEHDGDDLEELHRFTADLAKRRMAVMDERASRN
jgi:dsRNA-specific ribonuclease